MSPYRNLAYFIRRLPARNHVGQEILNLERRELEMNIRLKRFGIVAVFLLLVFGLSSTGKVAWAADPAMTSTTPDSTLTTSTVTFHWSAGDGLDMYYLGVGTSQASVENSPWGNIFIGSTGLNTSQQVTGIPLDGNTVYVRLWWRIGGRWKFIDYTYQTQTTTGGVCPECPDAWSKVIPNANDRFEMVMGGAAVLDKETCLVWDQSPDTTKWAWELAKIYCSTRGIGGRIGWHLPTVEQLASMVDRTQSNPSLPSGYENFFSQVQSDYYWTATSHAFGSTTHARDVDLGEGKVGADLKTRTNHVWCVRGGNTYDAY